MQQTRPQSQPQAPAAPGGTTVRPRPAMPPVLPAAPDYPSRWQLLLPRTARQLLADWGWWQNPVPLIPSDHLAQTIAVLERYGWGRSLDFSPTGRMCIRGAQTFLQHTGHVTSAGRDRAVDYMQQTLAEHGIHEPFHSWNDHTARTFPQVKHLITLSAHTARKNGE
ncbi:DUF6197 family protein [Streptomyces longwoodensis]|uniref:DUF6197 family protein n=1 Tax=Streptomyces longwoodensis TaxID=68231 RepID=UPI00225945B3|nr:hypothetical protein [Streptomyces longwoodensis]MCX5001008.1 hypothetical protein [Streptomyces longwoodensis]